MTQPNKNIITNNFELSDENINEFIEYYKNPENQIWNYRSSDDKDSTYLHILIKKDQFEIATQLINFVREHTSPETFAIFINAGDNIGLTAFHLSCYKGNIKFIKFLISNGADYKLKTSTGLCCLHYSAQINKIAPIYYMAKKYDINLYEKDNKGNTFFHWACYCASEKVIAFFLSDKNFNINIQNNDGYIPLHYYIMSRKTGALKKLIKRGADPFIKNNRGENAFDLVKQYYNEEKCVQNNILNSYKFSTYIDFPYYIFIFFHFVWIFIMIIFNFPFININHFWLLFIGYIIWELFICSYIFHFLNMDPGICGLNNDSEYLINEIEKEEHIDLYNYCIKCQNKKEFRTVHCYICDRCIQEFDHHCIWVNKCIGKYNKESFNILVILLLINAFFNLILSLLSFENEQYSNFTKIFRFFYFGNITLIKLINKVLFILYLFYSMSLLIIIIPIIKFMIDHGFTYNIDIYETKNNNDNLIENTNDETVNLLVKNKNV